MAIDDRKAVHLSAEARLRLKLLAAVRGVKMQDLMSDLVNEAFDRECGNDGALKGLTREHVFASDGGEQP